MDRFIKRISIIFLIISLVQCQEDTSPTVPYFNIKSVFAGGVSCYATISDDGGAGISERGFEWKTEHESNYPNKKIAFDNGLNYFETIINGLSPGTTYYFRAYAINNRGTGYSEEQEITTLQTGSFTDNRDGRIYRWVEIGNQIWMAENLSFLPYISSFTSDTGIFVYNYKGSSVDAARIQEEYKRYGCLYSWRISLQACPEGWHLPSEDEWQQLERSIGLTLRQISGADPVNPYTFGFLKSPDWWSQSNNVTLFSALPGGYHFHSTINYQDIYFHNLGAEAHFWSSTYYDDAYIKMTIDYGHIYNNLVGFDPGCSVRCIKDEL